MAAAVYSLSFVSQSSFLLSVMLCSAFSWDPRMGRPMGMMPGPGPPSGHGMKGGGKHNEESLGEFFGVVKSYNPDKGWVRPIPRTTFLQEKKRQNAVLSLLHVCRAFSHV